MGKQLKYIVCILFLMLFIATSLCLNVHQCSNRNVEPYMDTIRTTIVDTIAYYKPILKDSTVINYVTVRLPKADDKEDNFPNKTVTKLPESVQKFPESDKNLQDSVQNFSKSVPEDSVTVQIPITQKVYEDSTYTAYVSGYRASLDSLVFKMPREVITIKEYSKPKRWSVGVQVGYGVTLKGTPQFAPYVGIGVSYNLFSF